MKSHQWTGGVCKICGVNGDPSMRSRCPGTKNPQNAIKMAVKDKRLTIRTSKGNVPLSWQEMIGGTCNPVQKGLCKKLAFKNVEGATLNKVGEGTVWTKKSLYHFIPLLLSGFHRFRRNPTKKATIFPSIVKP